MKKGKVREVKKREGRGREGEEREGKGKGEWAAFPLPTSPHP